MRPLLFLDVDGPLIPFGGEHPEYGPADEDKRRTETIIDFAVSRPFVWIDDGDWLADLARR